MRKYILLAIIITTAFVACNKINTPPKSHNDRLAKLLLKDTLQLYVGETRNVPLSISPSNYNLDSLKYLSSDTTVITITKVGVLAAKKVGLSTITISNLTSTISINTHITVVPAPIDSLKLGLLAYYPFNNSGVDESGNGNNGVVYNITGTTDRNGRTNAAYHFDGASSYIRVKDNQALRLSNTDFTLSAWVKLDSYDSSFGSNIFSKHITGANNGWGWSITGYSSPVIGVPFYGPGGGSLNATGIGANVIDTAKWHMVTTVYNIGTQQLSMYIDGRLNNVTNNILSPNAAINAPLYIGRDNPLATSGYFIRGSLDELRIYNRSLTATQIKLLYLITY